MPIKIRKNEERGFANHGWLKTYHTFSFANYYDPNWEEFGSLRVVNEDRIMPGKGFGTHFHKEYEIFSYVIEGELEHKDSMNNIEIIKRGDVQFTSAGNGIYHSEYNHSLSNEVHFLQIWCKPNKKNLKPSYITKSFTDQEKLNKLCHIISPKEENFKEGTIPIHQDFYMFASILEKDKIIYYNFQNKKRKGFIHVITNKGNSIKVNDIILHEGDAAFITEEEKIIIIGNNLTTEFILFDFV